MLRKSVLFFVVLLALSFVFGQAGTAFAMDAGSSTEQQSGAYKAQLTIGSLTFSGTLTRMDAVSEEEKKKAIEETLREMGITEDNLEAARLQIEKTEQSEDLTREEVDAFVDKLLELTGVDNLADVWDALFGESGEQLPEALAGLAGDEAKDRLVDAILERTMSTAAEAASTALNTAETIVKAALMSLEQYQKDKEKWENRAAAAIAERLLRDFSEKLNEKLRQRKDSQPGGWVLSIQSTSDHYFSFYGISGNLEIWEANLMLQKYDRSSEDEGPGGTYKGMGTFTIKYEMSQFDNGLKDRFVQTFMQVNDDTLRASGMNVGLYQDNITPTIIKRTITVKNCSVEITAGSYFHGESTQPLNISSFSDQKNISISHDVSNLTEWEQKTAKITIDFQALLRAQDTESLSVSIIKTSTVQEKKSGFKQTQDLTKGDNKWEWPWDPAIWEIWDQEKKIIITMP